MKAFVLTRDVSSTSCEGLDRDLKQGSVVYLADEHDSAVDPGAAICRLTPRAPNTFALPRASLVEYQRTWEQTCYMPHDPAL